MADRQNKRKHGPGDSRGGAPFKKAKGGKAGRWKTPAEEAKHGDKLLMGKTLEVGDEGIWVTFARGMRGKAIREFTDLCEEYGKEMYGIKPSSEEEESKEEEEDLGIEASIEQELNSMKTSQKPKSRKPFTPVPTSLECIFFMKTMQPVDPEALTRKICEDARDCPDPMARKCKYINRLTPVMAMDKATEKGIEQVARKVLATWFSLTSDSETATNPDEETVANAEGEAAVNLEGETVAKADGEAASRTSGETGDDGPAYTYAIRYNIRNHTAFKSGTVIQKIAKLVGPKHKVNLTSPDKVVLVEIYQHYCGISVVDGKQWEELKKYNMNELYVLKDSQAEKQDDA